MGCQGNSGHGLARNKISKSLRDRRKINKLFQPRVRKISPKFSCIKFFQIWDVRDPDVGMSRTKTLSKTTGKGHLHKVFFPEHPDVWVPDVPGISRPKTLCLGCFFRPDNLNCLHKETGSQWIISDHRQLVYCFFPVLDFRNLFLKTFIRIRRCTSGADRICE